MQDEETKYLLLKHVHLEIHNLIKQHKQEMGFSNLDQAVESIVFLALVDYPEEVDNLQNKIRNLENKIRESNRITIRYLENIKFGGGEHVIEHQLIGGNIHVMSHTMEITSRTTNDQLSKFLGVKVLSWNFIISEKQDQGDA